VQEGVQLLLRVDEATDSGDTADASAGTTSQNTPATPMPATAKPAVRSESPAPSSHATQVVTHAATHRATHHVLEPASPVLTDDQVAPSGAPGHHPADLVAGPGHPGHAYAYGHERHLHGHGHAHGHAHGHGQGLGHEHAGSHGLHRGWSL
jgi:hypothetical protein